MLKVAECYTSGQRALPDAASRPILIMMARTSELEDVTRVILSTPIRNGHKARLIAMSGIDSSGKGYVASRLSQHLSSEGARVALIGIDGWLNLPSVRFSVNDTGRHFYENAFRFAEMFSQFAVHNAHDCPDGGSNCDVATRLAAADTWLSSNIAPLLANPEFQQSGLFILTTDESRNSLENGGGKVTTVLVGTGVKASYQGTNSYDHRSLLDLSMKALGLMNIPNQADLANEMTEFYQ